MVCYAKVDDRGDLRFAAAAYGSGKIARLFNYNGHGYGGSGRA
jgi:hypothetical protein